MKGSRRGLLKGSVVRINERIEVGDQREETNDGSIRCICICNVGRGEMVCCDVCEGWTHLRYLGMKEGVGGMEGKEYVCHFCVSACLLVLRREIEGLRKELKEAREENGRMKSFLEQERLEGERVTQEEVKKNMASCGKVADTGDRLVEAMHMAAGKSEQQAGNQCRETSGVELSKSKKNRNKGKSVGRRKEVKRPMKGVPGV